jgi:DMSO/TMAO reductase YedYZ molybdopterin-dependent catalytic subunit
VPPGQHLVRDFPVLSAGPTPHTSPHTWDFSISGQVNEPKRWTWEELHALPSEIITRDIHCVTRWSKLDTVWEGVSVDTLLEGLEFDADYVIAYCDGGYTTNLPRDDVTGGKAWIVYAYNGEPLQPQHGGPARLLVPHLYLPLTYICGPTALVEGAASGMVALGHEPVRIRTERFGPTGR